MGCPGYMHVQCPGQGVERGSSCSLFGLRCWARNPCVCLRGIPAGISDCLHTSNHHVAVTPVQERTIDNTYLVAWYEQMPMRIEAAGGSLGKSFLSGEGFVVTFTGPGIVYVQTRAGGMFNG